MSITKGKTVYVVCGGSRGDIQPMIVFAKMISEKMNANVTIFANKHYSNWIQKEALGFQSLVGGIENRMDDVEVADAIIRGAPDVTLRLIMDFEGFTKDMLIIKDYCDSNSPPDLFVFGPVVMCYMRYLCEYYNKPFGVISLCPIHQTSDFPSIVFGISDLYFKILNWCSYYISRWASWFLLKDAQVKWRNMLGLPPKSYFDSLNINDLNFFYGFSNQIVQKPKDWPLENVTVGGYLFYENLIESLHSNIENFLQAGDKPVYIGFGSMNLHLSEVFTKLIEQTISACKDTRFIIAIPGLTPFTKEQSKKYEGFRSDRVLLIGSSPHHLLFPRCKVIVHHGGAGTTFSALRSGTPSIICYVLADQPFWGYRTVKLGTCAGFKKFASVTPDWLKEKIKIACTPEYAGTALYYSEKLKNEESSSVETWVNSMLK